MQNQNVSDLLIGLEKVKLYEKMAMIDDTLLFDLFRNTILMHLYKLDYFDRTGKGRYCTNAQDPGPVFSPPRYFLAYIFFKSDMDIGAFLMRQNQIRGLIAAEMKRKQLKKGALFNRRPSTHTSI